MQNNKNPNECPKLLRDHTPWEMVKGHNSPCLCTKCEGANAIKRGSKTAIKLIEPIITVDDANATNGTDTANNTNGANNIVDDANNTNTSDSNDTDAANNTNDINNIVSTNNTNINAATNETNTQSAAEKEADTRATTKLLKIFSILSKPSKYDMCVECLPCLGNVRKLEDAKIFFC